MNFLLMLGIMGLMLVFFHGRGHHKSSGEPNHHAAKPSVALTAPPEAPGATRRSSESPRPESKPDPASTPKVEPTSPSTLPTDPQAE